MDEITILCEPDEERQIRKILRNCPELEHTVSQKAKKYGRKIPLKLVVSPEEKEPYYNPNKNAIVVSCC